MSYVSQTGGSTKFSKFITDFSKYKKYWVLVLMFLPAIIYFSVFRYGPMYGVIIAFKNYKIRGTIMGADWVGLENFLFLFKQPTFFRAVINTFVVSLLRLITGFPMPIILAILLSEVRSTGFKKVTQTISYLPHFLSWVVLAGIFIPLLSPSSGPINLVLKAFGLKPIYFMADNNWFRTVLIVTGIWKGMGWGSIVYLATIAGISPSLYEAAECDGAGRMQKIFYITLPSLVPTITILLILNVGQMMNAGFDQIFNLYNPMVYEKADIIDTYVYRLGLQNMKYSLATAAGLFKNLIGFTLVITTNAITRRINDYGLW
jgi:putative aldouronate transport system permease protein